MANAGGFNPAGLATAITELIAAEGLTLRVAYIDGDNVMSGLEELQRAGHTLQNLDNGEPLTSWGAEPMAANAYLGGWGIVDALSEGADIVVAGRVTDASLTVGPAAWWHGWQRTSWDELAGAATGGNFSGFLEAPSMIDLSFPVAEVSADGSCVITKQSNRHGLVTVDTVTAQLIYEIQGPVYDLVRN